MTDTILSVLQHALGVDRFGRGVYRNHFVCCGVGQPAVSKWLQSGKRLPAEYVIAVERETLVSKHLLRPDIHPIDLPSPLSRTDGSIPGGTPVVLSDRRAVSDKKGGA